MRGGSTMFVGLNALHLVPARPLHRISRLVGFVFLQSGSLSIPVPPLAVRDVVSRKPRYTELRAPHLRNPLA